MPDHLVPNPYQSQKLREYRGRLHEEAAYRRRAYSFWIAGNARRRRERRVGVAVLTAAVTLVLLRIGGWL